MHETISDRVRSLEDQFNDLTHSFHHLKHNQEHIMATVQEIKDAAIAEKSEVQAKLAAVDVEIQSLKGQIAAGSAATPEQLDELKTAIVDIFTPAA